MESSVCLVWTESSQGQISGFKRIPRATRLRSAQDKRSVDRAEIIHWLEPKNQVHFSDLKAHIEDDYGVEFKSKQSYYDLFKEAGMSWKKTPKKIPNEMIPWWKKDTTKSVIC